LDISNLVFLVGDNHGTMVLNLASGSAIARATCHAQHAARAARVESTRF